MLYSSAHVDFAYVAFLVFVGFFISLLVYLRREDRREGYPLAEDSGRLQPAGGLFFTAKPKTFILPHGRGTVSAPNGSRDTRSLAARSSVVPGSPLIPTGDPMRDGIGPAAYAQRAKHADLTAHGLNKIVPISTTPDISIAARDPNPVGMRVRAADGKIAGEVNDVWVDRAEAMIRYLQLALADGSGNVLVPMTMAVIDRRRRLVCVDAITAAQFSLVPRLAAADHITFDEEERIVAYYGGGFLYALPQRAEPVL